MKNIIVSRYSSRGWVSTTEDIEDLPHAVPIQQFDAWVYENLGAAVQVKWEFDQDYKTYMQADGFIFWTGKEIVQREKIMYLGHHSTRGAWICCLYKSDKIFGFKDSPDVGISLQLIMGKQTLWKELSTLHGMRDPDVKTEMRDSLADLITDLNRPSG